MLSSRFSAQRQMLPKKSGRPRLNKSCHTKRYEANILTQSYIASSGAIELVLRGVVAFKEPCSIAHYSIPPYPVIGKIIWSPLKRSTRLGVIYYMHWNICHIALNCLTNNCHFGQKWLPWLIPDLHILRCSWYGSSWNIGKSPPFFINNMLCNSCFAILFSK